MCNLYTSARSREEVARLFAAQVPFDLPEVKSHAYPKQHGYIVRNAGGQRGLGVPFLYQLMGIP